MYKPSFNVLQDKTKRIRTIQDLCNAVDEIETSDSRVTDERMSAAETAIATKANQSDVTAALATKQNSSDIATINGSDITHGGNVTIVAAEG